MEGEALNGARQAFGGIGLGSYAGGGGLAIRSAGDLERRPRKTMVVGLLCFPGYGLMVINGVPELYTLDHGLPYIVDVEVFLSGPLVKTNPNRI